MFLHIYRKVTMIIHKIVFTFASKFSVVAQPAPLNYNDCM